MSHRLLAVATAALALAAPIAVAGCGGSSSSSTASTASVNPNAAESSPAGDIPDNQAFVSYSPPGAGYKVSVPEGWSRSSSGGAVTFTDKLNSIRLEAGSAGSAPTVADGQAELKKLASTVPGFQPGKVSTVQRSSGQVLKITYTGDGQPDPVTGKSVKDAFERYEFFSNGKLAVVTVSGPVGADNVDPWMTVTDSLQFTA